MRVVDAACVLLLFYLALNKICLCYKQVRYSTSSAEIQSPAFQTSFDEDLGVGGRKGSVRGRGRGVNLQALEIRGIQPTLEWFSQIY